MWRSILLVSLLCSYALLAQTVGTIYTPEIHIGSATTPSTVTSPPIEVINAATTGPIVSNAPPASTELLAMRHFDFITSPVNGVDFWPNAPENPVSLGEYARQLRAQKPKNRISPVITLPR